jgi:cysteine dioxygenase
MRNTHRPHRGLKWLLDQIRSQSTITPESLHALLAQVELRVTDPDVQPYVRFETENYARNFVLDDPRVQVLVLCWRPGQGSPIHDHGQSICGVRVVAGQATETIYEGSTASASQVSERELFKGDLSIGPGSLLHRIENRQAEDLITLHVYSPPLVKARR